jgi:hypothetical protein
MIERGWGRIITTSGVGASEPRRRTPREFFNNLFTFGFSHAILEVFPTE